MGEIVTNPPTIPNNVTDSWQPLVDRDTMSYYGLNRVTLTNWDDLTLEPQIAQGSAIDIDGSIARFDVDEAIGGSPVDGTIYLKFTVTGAVASAGFTSEEPEWYADKAGWYNAAGERYSGHYMTLSGADYSAKGKARDEPGGFSYGPRADGLFANDGINTDNFQMKFKYITATRAAADSGVAHGLDYDSIRGVTAYAKYGTSDEWNGIGQGYGTPQSGDAYCQWRGTSVYAHNLSTAWSNVRFIIFYEA